MSKKIFRVLALTLVMTILLSVVSASAATYKKTTTYNMVTCGDKLLRKTTLYVKNTSTGNMKPDLVLTVKSQQGGIYSSRTVCVIPANYTGVINFYTPFSKVGNVKFTVSPVGVLKDYSCSIWSSDGSPIVRIG